MSNNICININRRKRCSSHRSSSDRCRDLNDAENPISPETGNNLLDHLREFIGRTVTIFTTSGGESGEGFTGVLTRVSNGFVTLITQIGPGPSCALGNSCDTDFEIGSSNTTDRGRAIRNLGAETDIPVNRIAAFVHNAI